MGEEFRRSYIAKVPDQTRSEEIHQREDIFAFPGAEDSFQSLEDEPVVVVLTGWILAPGQRAG